MTIGEWFYYNNDNIKIGEKSDWNGEIKEQKFELKEINDTVFHYNKWTVDKYINNQLTEENEQNGFRIRKYKYYPEGQLKSVEHFEKGNIDYIESFNSNGYLIEIQHHDYEDSILVEKRTIKRKYDINDLKIEEITITESNNQRNESVTVYNYEQGKLLEVIENGNRIGKYTYNDFGDLIEKVYLGDKESFEYHKYDSKQNWLVRIMYHNGKPFKITEREIEYY